MDTASVTTQMDAARVITRSNSDLAAIELIMSNRTMSSQARMEAIWRRSREWANETEGSSGRASAEREFEARADRGTLYGN